MMDQAYEASLALAKGLLVRTIPPRHVRAMLDHTTPCKDLGDALSDDEVDVGDKCAVELAIIEDDSLPAVKKKVMASARLFVREFYLKMVDSLPWEFMLSMKTLNPHNLADLDVNACMYNLIGIDMIAEE